MPLPTPSSPPANLADDTSPGRADWKRWLGPGLLTGASDDDPSGIGTYSQAGAQFGYSMLWVMLFTFPLMAAVQLVSAHVGRVTGRGLAANLAKLMPKSLLVPLLMALFVTNTVNIGADLAAMGEAAALLLHGGPVAYAIVFGLVSIALQVFVPYSRYVGLLKWLTLSLLAYAATAMAVDVPWLEVLKNTVWPRPQLSRDYVEMFVAVLGTTISPYLFFWQSAQEVEEQRAAPDESPLKAAPGQAQRQLEKVKVDTILGMAVSNAVGFFIILTTAATLHAHGVHDVDSAARAAQALKPLAGRFAFALFALGIVGTGLLAIPVLAGSAAYALAECFGWKRGLERKPHAARRFYAVIALAALLGIGMTLMHVNPMRALVITAMINGVVSVPVLVAMMIAARAERVMGELPVGRAVTVAGWVTTVLMAVAAVLLFV